MDSKSLMIGDWVYFHAGYYEKPVGCTLQMIPIQVTIKALEDTLPLSPIPLTEEILMANGFDDEEGKRNYIIRTEFEKTISVALFDDGSVITISNSNLLRGINSIHICDNGYVHILQHALRLCGLTELADNFKIE